MNKKIIRLISILLSALVLFSCVITVSAEEAEAPAPAEKIKVEIRVEGVEKTLADKEIKVDASSTIKDILEAAALDVTYTADGAIASVKGENTVTTSVWQYAVDGAIKSEAVSSCKVEKDAEIIVFNATADAVIPSFDAEEIALSGVITFVGTDKSGTKAPIVNATVKWEVDSAFVSYTTDKNGRVYLAKDVLTTNEDHTIEIIKKNAYGVPMVVRFDAGTEVSVEELEDNAGEVKTLFEEIYDFFYSIFKGIVEVWGFYINAILGLFGVKLGQ